eukprot:1821260-Rhodomonas_salina.1
MLLKQNTAWNWLKAYDEELLDEGDFTHSESGSALLLSFVGPSLAVLNIITRRHPDGHAAWHVGWHLQNGIGRCDFLNAMWCSRGQVALYWAIISVSTMGYGDILPVTSLTDSRTHTKHMQTRFAARNRGVLPWIARYRERGEDLCRVCRGCRHGGLQHLHGQPHQLGRAGPCSRDALCSREMECIASEMVRCDLLCARWSDGMCCVHETCSLRDLSAEHGSASVMRCRGTQSTGMLWRFENKLRHVNEWLEWRKRPAPTLTPLSHTAAHSLI